MHTMIRRSARNQREFNVLVGAATVHDGQFLLLQRSSREGFLPNAWGIPAGQVKYEEEPKDACLRELQEETGLKGEIVELVGYSFFKSKRGKGRLTNIQLNFLVDVEVGAVELDRDSHSNFQWIPMGDEDNNLLDSFTRKIMVSACMYLKQASTLRTIQSSGSRGRP
jgi:8-oxo-dGTP pyrophosphatase MutT (NUDIX family)